MSVYRLEIDMAFKEEDDMKSFLNLLEDMSDKMAEKQEGDLPIHRKVRYHSCNHDTGGACSGYVSVEFDGVKKQEVPSDAIIPEIVKTEIKKTLQEEKDVLVSEKDALVAENATLVAEKEVLVNEKAALTLEVEAAKPEVIVEK